MTSRQYIRSSTKEEKNPVIGYYVAENTSGFVVPEIKEKNKMFLVIETILQDFTLNRNKRVYTRNLLEQSLKDPAILEMKQMKSWYGEAGHPISKELQRLINIDQTRISHIITETSVNTDNVVGRIETANTSMGKDFRGLIEQGSKVGFSLRGFAKSIKKENTEFVQAPLKSLTYDWVIFPSHKAAYMTKVLSESAIFMRDTCINISQDDVVSLLKTESADFNFFLDFVNKEVQEEIKAVRLNGNATTVEITLESGTQFLTIEKFARNAMLKHL